MPKRRRTRMRKYSKSATRMKAMLIRIQRMRGQIPSEEVDGYISCPTNPILGMFDVRHQLGHKPDGGMLSVALLFRLIVIRRRVRRRPSLHTIVFNIIIVDNCSV